MTITLAFVFFCVRTDFELLFLVDDDDEVFVSVCDDEFCLIHGSNALFASCCVPTDFVLLWLSEFNTLEDIDLQLLQLHLLAVCVLVKTVDKVPDDEKSRNFCDDEIGCGSVFVRTLIFAFDMSPASRLMLNDDRRRALLSKLPIRKMSAPSFFMSSMILSFFCLAEHSLLVELPFLLVAFGLHTLSSLFLVNEVCGVGDSFSYSRTGKSFKLRRRAIFMLVDVDVDAVVRLDDDFDEPAQRHLCELWSLTISFFFADLGTPFELSVLMLVDCVVFPLLLWSRSFVPFEPTVESIFLLLSTVAANNDGCLVFASSDGSCSGCWFGCGSAQMPDPLC